MNRYLVRVTETFQKFVYVEADDVEDANMRAWDSFNKFDPQFVLTADDFKDIDFYVYDDEE